MNATRIDAYVTVPVESLSRKEWERLERAVSYVDASGAPYTALRPKPRLNAVQLTRGAWAHLPDHVRYRDERAFPPKPKLKLAESFKLDAKLDDGREFHGQEDAVAAMFHEEQGLVIRPPGTGKTQIAVKFLAECGTRALVLVHTEDVLDQWQRYLKEAGIPEDRIGLIQGKTLRIRQITLCMVQTFYNLMLDNPDIWRDKFGAVIVDEAHHAPANTWEVILNNLAARYRFGLTASPTRADGHHPYIRLLIGPVIHEQPFHSAVALQVHVVKTDFKFSYRGSYDWGSLLRAITHDPERNDEIARIAMAEAKRGNSVLILSRRIEHLTEIAERLGTRHEILTGRRHSSDRKRILADFRAGRIRILLATQLADEALDVPVLNRVMLVHPGKAEGRIIQQIGRALREHEGKFDAVIYDFYDHKIRVLKRQFLKRLSIYNKLGIKVKGGGVKVWLSKSVSKVGM